MFDCLRLAFDCLRPAGASFPAISHSLCHMSEGFSPLGENPETVERQAARLGRAAGLSAGISTTGRKYKPGGCLGLKTVISLLVTVVLLIIVASIVRGVPLWSQKKTASIEQAVTHFVADGPLSIPSGQIRFAGASVLFLGPNNAYATAPEIVEPSTNFAFVNGSFTSHGRVWCTAVSYAGTIKVTTQAGVQSAATMCGALGQPTTR